MIGGVPQAHGIKFRLNEECMNCSCRKLFFFKEPRLKGAWVFSTLCVCVCSDKCHCLPSVDFILLKNVKTFNETMIYLSSLLRCREWGMSPIYWDHYHKQWIRIYHELPVIKDEECMQWIDRPHLFVPSLSVLCSRPWPHGTKCSQKWILRGNTVSVFLLW